MDKTPFVKIQNKTPPKPSDRKKKAVALSLATCVLMGIIGYEVIREKELKPIRSTAPVQDFVIPTLESQNEELQIELNRSLQKLNEMKRLLFVRNHAPENTAVRELKVAIQEKEKSLDDLRSQMSRYEQDITQERLKAATLETSLTALADLVEIQRANKSKYESELNQSIADALQESAQHSKTVTKSLEDVLSERNKEIEGLRKQIAEEKRQINALAQALDSERTHILEDFKYKQEAHYADEESWKQNNADLRREIELANRALEEKDAEILKAKGQINDLASNINRLNDEIAERDQSHKETRITLDSSLKNQAEIADELVVHRALGSILSSKEAATFEQGSTSLRDQIDTLQNELQLANATLEQEKQAKAEIYEKLEALIQKSATIESELAEKHAQLLAAQAAPEGDNNLAHEAARLQDELAVAHTTHALEKQALVESIQNDLESKASAVKKDLEDALALVHSQREKELALNEMLANLREEYHSMQNNPSFNGDHEKTLLSKLNAEQLDINETLMFEHLADLLKIEQLTTDLDQLSVALTNAEKEREQLKQDLESRLADLGHSHEATESHMSTLKMALDAERNEKSSLMTQIANFMDLREQEDAYVLQLTEDLNSTKNAQASVAQKLSEQEAELTRQQAAWEEQSLKFHAEKTELETQIAALKTKIDLENEQLAQARLDLEHLRNSSTAIADNNGDIEGKIAEKVAMLQSTSDEHEQQKIAIKQECEALQTALDAEKNRSSMLNNELQIALQNFEAVSKDIEGLRSNLQEKEDALVQIKTADESSLAAMRQEIADLKQSLGGNLDQHETLSTVRAELAEKENLLAQLRQSGADQVAQLNSVIDGLNTSLSSAKSELSSGNDLKMQLEEKEKAFELAKQADLEQIAKLNQDIDALKQHLNDAEEQARLASNLKDQLQEKETLLASNKQNEADQLARLNAEIESLKTALNEAHGQDQAFASLKGQVEEKEALLARCKIEHSEQTAQLNNELDALRKDLSLAHEQTQSLSALQDQLREKEGHIADLIERHPQQLALLSDEINDLKKSLADAEDARTQLARGRQDNEEQIQRLMNEIQQLQGQVSQAEQEKLSHAQVKSQLEAVNFEHSQKETALQEMAKKLDESNAAYRDAQNALATARSELSVLNEAIFAAKQNDKDALPGMQEFKSLLSQKVARLEEKERNLDQLTKENHEMQAQFQIEQSALDMAVSDLEELEARYNNVLAKEKDLDSQVAELKNNHSAATSELKQALDAKEREYKELLERSNSSQENLRHEVAALQEKFDQQSRISTQLKDELVATTDKFEQTLNQTRSLGEEYNSKQSELQSRIQREVASKEMLESELKDLRNEMARATEDSQNLKEQIERLHSNSQATSAGIADMERELLEKQQRFTADLEAANNTTQQLESEIRNLLQAKNAEAERSAMLEKQLRETESHLSETTEALEHMQKQVSLKEEAVQQHVENRETLSQQIAELHQMLDSRIRHSAELEENLANINKKYNETLESVQRAQSELDDKSQQASHYELRSQEREKQLTEEMEHLQASLQTERTRADEVASELNAIKEQYGSANAKIAELQSRSDAQPKSDQAAEALNANLMRLQAENREIKARYEALSAYLETQRNALMQMQQQRDQLADQMQRRRFGHAR